MNEGRGKTGLTLGTFAHTRDMEVAIDVSRMMELRRFEEEFVVYGRMFYEDGARQFLSGSNEERIWAFGENRDNYMKYPFPLVKYSVKTTVPAGTEEIIMESMKIRLAKIMQRTYTHNFCAEFYQIAQSEPDNQAEEILQELQEKIVGLYSKSNLIAFEGLMNAAYRGKHLVDSSRFMLETWLQRERKEMENDPIVERRLQKTFYGFCYYKDGKIKNYCNGEKARTYEKREALLIQGYLISAVYEKTYWHNGELTVQIMKDDFQHELQKVFDDIYFTYLLRIYQLPSCVDPLSFDTLKKRYEKENTSVAQTIALYETYWGLREKM